ncbi:MAG: FAD-binding oxidoreductase [Pseudomonadota bacterium]
MNHYRINQVPVNDNGNGWNKILPDRTPKAALEGDIKANWVVVGAGYAGLAAARRLAENRPQDTIVLLEADVAGENASGRNSGFAIDIPHNVSSSLEELEGSHRYMALARAAIDYHEKQINRYQIDCDWSQPGKYHCAVAPRAIRDVLEPVARELEALKEPYEWIEKKDLDQRLGTSHFSGAIHTPGCRLMNPAALVRGLADNLPDNVSLHEHSPVTEMQVGSSVVLKTENGSVTADKLILGVNGFAEQFGYPKRRLLGFTANASLSRRLTADERERLGCEEDWGVTPTNAIAAVTMRFTKDHRILIRNNIYFNPSNRENQDFRDNIQRVHKQMFDERFPMLPEVSMEYTWSGFLCLSHNGSPGFGQLSDKVYTAICQNAVGVTKGTASGMLVADMACGEDNELIGFMQSLGQPNQLPMQPFLNVGAHLRVAWERWKHRDDI